MESFDLGPIPNGWEAKIEPKMGRIYFINHPEKYTTWNDPRLKSIPSPPYHIAINQPTAYFEDGSRWSSPVPSLRAFTLNRRGSSPRLGGSPRIAPSPTPAPKRSSADHQVLFDGGIVVPETKSKLQQSSGVQQSAAAAAAASSESHAGPSRLRSASIGTTSNAPLLNNNEIPYERPQSARSFSSSVIYNNGLPSNFLSNCDTETAFRTVCALFPTAAEPHVRHLFHKYHNRATLVVSALQVEKHPYIAEIANQLELKLSKDGDSETMGSLGESKSIGIHSPFKTNLSFTTTTGGSPARTGTPISLLKFSNNPSSAGSIHTRWGSPLLSMSPHLQMVKEESIQSKSPKMKLKYLKGIFPAADETFLLDVLISAEDNIQRATEKLVQKGFTRTPPAKPARQKWLEVKLLIEKRNKALEQQRLVNQMHLAMGEPVESPFPTPIMKTARPHLSDEQRERVKADLILKFPNLPDRFVAWAAEAAKFEVEKAARLLRELGPETPDEFKPFVVSSPAKGAGDSSSEKRMVRFAETSDTMAEVVKTVIGGLSWKNDEIKLMENLDTPDSGYFELEGRNRKKSFITGLFGSKSEKEREKKEYVKSSKMAKGPNFYLAKGPNSSLLQPVYLSVNGPSPSLSKGPQASNRLGSTGLARGPNPKLAKGPVWANKKNSPIASQQGFHHVTVGGH